MIAFVLSGAGNRGPLQIGAMRTLLEAEIRPAFLVGTSAGAVNASFVAARGFSAETLDKMEAQWARVSAKTVYPGNLVTAAWRFVSGKNSLYANDGLRKLIQAGLPSGVTQFGQLALPLYVATVDLISSQLFLFGEGASAPLVDAVLASGAVPVLHPPVEYHGLQLVDGGVLANVAASVAMDKQATDIYVLNAGWYSGRPQLPANNVLEIVDSTLTVMMAQTLLQDLARAEADPSINLHHISMPAFREIGFRDFSQCQALLQAGYDTAKAYLAAPRPQIVAPPAPRRPDLGEVVPGAREFIPPYLQPVP